MLLTSISTNVAMAHEIPAATLPHMNVYCDDRTVSPAIAGEMVLAVRDGGELTTGRARAADHGMPHFFRSMGLGIEDVKMAFEIHRLHLRAA